MTDKFMVFDVESIGLHGEGFAAAGCCAACGEVFDLDDHTDEEDDES